MDLTLKNINWKEFFLNDIFNEIQRGKRLKKGDHKKGQMPYVSSTAMNNGIDNFISNKDKVRIFSNCLTIANSGSVGACFYHPYEFVASDHITKLENRELNKYILLFISTIVQRLGEKYSFNREINDTRIKREKIMLPVNQKGNPDYQFMEDYMKQLETQKIETYKKYVSKKKALELKRIKKISEKKWKEFIIESLFDTKIGKSIDGNKVNRMSGKIAYITRKEKNNSLDGFINYNKYYLNTQYPVITIGNETAEPFVQNYPFFTGTKVNILIPKQNISNYSLSFIATSLRKHKKKYSYSFTINSTRLKKQKILLPVNDNNKPDYEYMENYMKQIELNKLKAYLEYKKL